MLLGLVAATQAILPNLLRRKTGFIISAFDDAAVNAMSYTSGAGPAQAAARNYLLSLDREVRRRGVRIGMVTIAGLLAGSARHRNLSLNPSSDPYGHSLPEFDPDEIATVLFRLAVERAEAEVFCPPMLSPLFPAGHL